VGGPGDEDCLAVSDDTGALWLAGSHTEGLLLEPSQDLRPTLGRRTGYLAQLRDGLLVSSGAFGGDYVFVRDLVAVDGGLALVGDLEGMADLDPGPGEQRLTGTTEDGFAFGAPAGWANLLTGPGRQTLVSAAPLPDGSLVVTGSAGSWAILGGRPANHLLLARLGRNGEPIWTLPGPSHARSTGVAARAGAIAVVGSAGASDGGDTSRVFVMRARP
jgi:hypothetical protein